MSDARRIMVVDDQPCRLRALSQVLQREGVRVVEARDGDQALAVARRERPDLAFLDLGMPKQGGFEVLAGTRGPAAPP